MVDCAVTLTDGSYHSVDSSELAFRLAGRIAMAEGLQAASPHLLEPVQKVVVMCPSNASSRITSAIASRRGQMLGMAPRDGWDGWDRIDALIPEVAEDITVGTFHSIGLTVLRENAKAVYNYK